MAKKKKAPVLEAWCWYCDRDFEDDKVLLQHQRAKHYKCPQCPRRLNTAGGLTVHLHQVHKAEPGRDSFDMEIYGMAGIPEADLAEWQARKARGGNGGASNGQPPSKKPKVESVALTPEQLKAQLEAHKALMSGGSSSQIPEASSSVPPPGFNPGVQGAPSGPSGAGSYQQQPPNPAYGGYNQPPPHQYNAPPPGFGPPPARPGFPAGPPPSNPAFAGFPSGPPPPQYQNPGYGNNFASHQGGPRQWGPPPSANPAMYNGPPPPIPQPQYSPHQIAVRTGAKSRMVYTDKEISPEEKLASMGKYRYIDPDDGPLNAVQAQAPIQPSFEGPPPPHYPQAGQQPFHHVQQPYNGPPPSSMWPQRHSSSASASASPAPPASSFPPQGSPPAQSYPAVAPGALPPSADPHANTAEALSKANANTSVTASIVGNGMANGDGVSQREAEVGRMVEGVKHEEKEGDVRSVDQQLVSGAGGGQKQVGHEGESAAMKGRKRAADLF